MEMRALTSELRVHGVTFLDTYVGNYTTSHHIKELLYRLYQKGPAIFFTFYELIFAPSKSDLGNYTNCARALMAQ